MEMLVYLKIKHFNVFLFIYFLLGSQLLKTLKVRFIYRYERLESKMDKLH